MVAEPLNEAARRLLDDLVRFDLIGRGMVPEWESRLLEVQAQAAAQMATAVEARDELLEALGWFVGPEASNYFRDIPMDLVLKAKARYGNALDAARNLLKDPAE